MFKYRIQASLEGATFLENYNPVNTKTDYFEPDIGDFTLKCTLKKIVRHSMKKKTILIFRIKKKFKTGSAQALYGVGILCTPFKPKEMSYEKLKEFNKNFVAMICKKTDEYDRDNLLDSLPDCDNRKRTKKESSCSDME